MRIVYGQSSIDSRELQGFLNEIAQGISDPAGADVADLADLGLTPSDVSDLAFSVEEDAQGAFLETIAIGIITKVAADLARAIWEKIVWPKVSKKFGKDSLTEPRDEAE